MTARAFLVRGLLAGLVAGTFLDGRRVTVPTQVPLDTPIKIGTTTFELRR